MTHPASDNLLQRLPPDAAGLVAKAAAAASSSGARAYLVGGIVRDLILGRASLDLDLAVEGDAIVLARALAAMTPGRLVTHQDFGTATLYVDHLVLDLASTRTESYPRPGALPVVKAGGIEEDLRRRDFTINAIALALNSPNHGAMLDPLGGAADLRAGLVRLIHDRGFIDDATRMLRAVRYEQRLRFRLEVGTEALLRRDTSMLRTISGERIRYELERTFLEERPGEVLARADALSLLRAIDPSLRWDAGKTASLLTVGRLEGKRLAIDAAILTLGMPEVDVLRVAERLRFPKEWLAAAKDAATVMALATRLEEPGLKRSALETMLGGMSREGVEAAGAAAPSLPMQQGLRLYLDVVSKARPILTGRDILSMGVPQGPAVGEALAALKAASLDGEVATREEETAWVMAWLALGRRARGNR